MDLLRPTFYSMRLEATSSCNLGCRYCFASNTMNARKSDDMTREEFQRILGMAREAGIRKVLYSGGEPFARPDFVDILGDSYGIKTSFVTNGSFVTDDHLRAIAEMQHVNRIRFSIDGFEGHDAVRSGSSWEQVIDRIAACRRIIPRVSVVPQTVASPATLDEIPKLLVELEKLGVDRWRLFFLRFSGRISRGSVRVDSDYYRRYVELIRTVARMSAERKITMQIEVDGGFQSNLDSVLERYEYPGYDERTHPCQYLAHVLMIRSNGDLSVCPFFEFGVGNVRDFDSIAAMQEHLPLVAWRNQRVSSIEKCVGCRYEKICTAGCRKTAFDTLGSYHAEDPVFCTMMPMIESRVWPVLSERVQAHYRSLLNEDGKMPEWTGDELDRLLGSYFDSSRQRVYNVSI